MVASPIGDLVLIGDGQSLARLLTPQQVGPSVTELDRDDSAFGPARGQLAEYFDGRRTRFELRLATAGTAFQRQVWNLLLEIPYGSTTTYAELADRMGRAPSAARAVGSANARNPVSIIVPCHRVVGSDGSLTGYAGGLATKRWLLTHEGGSLATSG
ncbi:MAG TPA: methylated-DNA--[protein]-cysteine S-methyltransferase [Jatrophihabitans sp.]